MFLYIRCFGSRIYREFGMRRGNYEYGLGFRVWVLMHPIDLISWERVH